MVTVPVAQAKLCFRSLFISIDPQPVIRYVHNRDEKLFNTGKQIFHLISKINKANLPDARTKRCHFTAVFYSPVKLSTCFFQSIVNLSLVDQSLIKKNLRIVKQ